MARMSGRPLFVPGPVMRKKSLGNKNLSKGKSYWSSPKGSKKKKGPMTSGPKRVCGRLLGVRDGKATSGQNENIRQRGWPRLLHSVSTGRTGARGENTGKKESRVGDQ